MSDDASELVKKYAKYKCPRCGLEQLLIPGENISPPLAAPAESAACKCWRYEPDEHTRYADVMTGGDGLGWTVTQDCPIHRKSRPSGLVAELQKWRNKWWAGVNTVAMLEFEAILQKYQQAESIQPQEGE